MQVDVDLWFLWVEGGPVEVRDYAPSSSEIEFWALVEGVPYDKVMVHQESVTVVLTNNANEGE